MSVIKRIFQPSVTHNDNDYSYYLNSLNYKEVISLLSSDMAGGGVFGLECHHTLFDDTITFFAPSYYKVDWSKTVRDSIFNELEEHKRRITFIQLYTLKSSMFPINMQSTESLWEKIIEECPSNIGIVYQLLLSYRQDNWKERLEDQYNDYLNGIESPSDITIMRKFQRKINDSLDSVLKWQYNHAPIQEVEQKLKENGFRYNIRFCLYGGSRKDRKKFASRIKEIIDKWSYTNIWGMNTIFITDDIVQNMKNRKIDNVGKQQVLTVSEIIPFLTFGVEKQKAKELITTKPEPLPEIKPIRIVAQQSTPFEAYFDLLPYGKKIEQVDGNEMGVKFVNALKTLGKIKSNIPIKKTESGATTIKLTFTLPKGLKLSEINKKSVIEDVQTFMGIKDIRITQGDDIGEIDVWLPQQNRQKVFLRNYIDTPDFKEYVKNHPLPFFVGTDEIGRAIYKCLSDTRHILVVGTTGSGKSVWLNQFILTLLMVRKPEELKFYMIDVKQVELPIYRKFPHVQKVITDAEDAILLLEQLVKEMDNRYKLLHENEVNHIELYNAKRPQNKLPYIICVIDEYAELASRNKDVHNLIQSIAQLSRAAGIHLVIATQRPSVDVIPGIIKANIPGKIGFRCSDNQSYRTIFNTVPPFNLLGKGDGSMSFEEQSTEHIRFQGCLIIDDPKKQGLEAKLINSIAKRINETYDEQPKKEEIKIETELDKLKKIIATTGETRLFPLREKMKINSNRLKDLMTILVEEKWLETPETKQSGYKLIVSEEEKSKWR